MKTDRLEALIERCDQHIMEIDLSIQSLKTKISLIDLLRKNELKEKALETATVTNA